MKTQQKLYPVVDRLDRADLEKLGLSSFDVKGPYTSLGMAVRDVHAVATGEKRPPRKGEWYLSGAIIEAYRAPNDLSTAYHIARLVRTKTETITKIATDAAQAEAFELGFAAERKQAEQERDELLAKLEYALEFPRALLTNEGFKAEVRAAIAKAESRSTREGRQE